MTVPAQQLDLLHPPAAVARALAEVAEAWEAEWKPRSGGGHLALPVVFGLRRGVVAGSIAWTPRGESGTQLRFTPEESLLAVDRSSVAVLSFAAVPLVVTIVWPFWPALFALVPFAAVSGLVAWWLVVSRLRSRGPEEFLAEVATRAAAGESVAGVIR